MAFDLLIKNGTVVDGTGAPSYKADVAVAAGKIVEVGKGLVGKAHRVIDASNLIVTPGFVDPHTHYDAQICWDPQSQQFVLERSHHGIAGELRSRDRAMQNRSAVAEM